MRMRRVVIVQSFLKAFRVPFYRRLIERLRATGIELELLFGQPDRFHSGDADIVRELPFARRVRNIYLYAGRRSLVLQPVLHRVLGADLVIVQQGNRHLLNHVLLCGRGLLDCRLAFWGHGRNFQTDSPNGFSERLKRACSRHVDHWFAYTEKSRSVLLGVGVSPGKITTVQNAVDTADMTAELDSLTHEEIHAARRQLGIDRAQPVAIWCGRFYATKAVEFMLEAACRIRAERGDFHLLFVGDGQQARIVADFCRDNAQWAHYMGPRYGRDKALCFALAKCQLMPGAVGLSVVDSFAYETPLITRDLPTHGPEIEYLSHGVNGLIAADDVHGFASDVLSYLGDDDMQQRLIEGCRRAREQYTVENMADRFSSGIACALSRPGGD